MKRGRSTGTPTADQVQRFEAIKSLGCICCLKNLADDVADGGDYEASGEYVEAHHLNGGGNHGQKRRGHDFVIPLCVWHHKGLGHAAEKTRLFGPSWAKGSKPFRAAYGTDDELLATVNQMIGTTSEERTP